MRKLILLAMLVLGTSVLAQPPAPINPIAPVKEALPQSPSAPKVATLSAADLSAWLDGYVPHALARGGIAGAVVTVVQGDQVVAMKGYGYADVAKRVPVDPRRHLFRPGSIAKLFTWTAVMQLVEQGKLNLDQDINSYLDFRIPARADGPITLRHLMTHTPGFEEAVRALITPDVANVGLERELKRWVPRRVYKAGSTPAYSNYGTALAGYIVERVSGLDFDTYVERRIFAPLQMQSSSFRQPLPPALMAQMSKGYSTASGQPLPYEYVSLPPVGSLAATAPDMANFMIAHLRQGAFGGARILQADTARRMHGTPHRVLPPLHAMLLGFYESHVNGRRVIAHSGDTLQFHSEINLFVDDGVGLYISMNSLGVNGAAADVRTALFHDFADRYFGRDEARAKTLATAAEHAAMMAGRYDNSRRSHTSFLGGLSLLGQARLTDNGDGTISFPALTDLAGAPKRWREIAPFVWREEHGEARLAAQVVDGQIVRIGTDPYPYMVWDRAPGWRNTSWLLPASILALTIFALTLFIWPTAKLVRRRHGVTMSLTGRPRIAYLGVRVAALCVLVAIVLWALLLQTLLANLNPSPAFDVQVIVATVLTLVGAIGGLVLAIWNLVEARRGRRGWWSYVANTLLAVAFATILWVGFVFNLFAFSTQF